MDIIRMFVTWLAFAAGSHQQVVDRGGIMLAMPNIQVEVGLNDHDARYPAWTDFKGKPDG
jgi:hypothetical protein